MKYLQEITTEWKVDYRVPCHTYILNEKKECIGYIKEGTTEQHMFKHPMKQFSRSKRKFKDVTKKYI